MRMLFVLLTALLVGTGVTGCNHARQSRQCNAVETGCGCGCGCGSGGEMNLGTPHFGDVPGQPMPMQPYVPMQKVGEPLPMPKGI